MTHNTNISTEVFFYLAIEYIKWLKHWKIQHKIMFRCKIGITGEVILILTYFECTKCVWFRRDFIEWSSMFLLPLLINFWQFLFFSEFSTFWMLNFQWNNRKFANRLSGSVWHVKTFFSPNNGDGKFVECPWFKHFLSVLISLIRREMRYTTLTIYGDGAIEKIFHVCDGQI